MKWKVKIMNKIYSKRTLDYLKREKEIINTSYGRTNKNVKNRDLMFNKAKLNISKCSDTLFAPLKHPLTLLLLFSTVSMGSYIAITNTMDIKEDYKFFNSLENDSTIPKEILLRVQKHYYNK